MNLVLREGWLNGVVKGQTTAYLRPRKPSDKRCPFDIGETYAVVTLSHEERSEDGHVWKVPKQSPERARVRIEGVASPYLSSDFSDDLAQSAGFDSAGHLFRKWREWHMKGPVPMDDGSWKDADPPPLWLVWFKVCDKPRHMSWSGMPRGDEHGYSLRAQMRGEPECVPQTWLEDETALRRRQETAERNAIPIEDRLAQAKQLAKQKGIDVGLIEKSIERRVEAMEKRARGKAA